MRHFYELLDETYEQCHSYVTNIVLGDFNTKLGREGIFGSTVGKYSLHDITSDNRLRLIDLDEGSLDCFERRILRVIFSPVCIYGEWRRRYSDIDLARRVNVKRLRWLVPCRVNAPVAHASESRQ